MYLLNFLKCWQPSAVKLPTPTGRTYLFFRVHSGKHLAYQKQDIAGVPRDTAAFKVNGPVGFCSPILQEGDRAPSQPCTIKVYNNILKIMNNVGTKQNL